MKTLHHTYVKKAAKIGVQLTLRDNRVRAFWPERNLEIFAADGKEAIEQMQEAQNHMVDQELEDKFVEDPIHTIDKVPTNGRQAFHKGFMAADCPYAELPNSVDFDRWNAEFDAAADEPIPPPEEEEKKPASVVKPKYRAIYAELGHPTTCGDELAMKIDNLVKNAKGTNIEYLDAILKVNEVDMSKYNRTNPGWQGRYRMTGRNMLAKRVHANGGVLKLPDTTELRMSADWMSSQRFQR
jgi:hypothetical protein